MHLFTVLISSAFVLAGMSTALPVERENMLVARFADLLAEVEARAYGKEPELYARGGKQSSAVDSDSADNLLSSPESSRSRHRKILLENGINDERERKKDKRPSRPAIPSSSREGRRGS